MSARVATVMYGIAGVALVASAALLLRPAATDVPPIVPAALAPAAATAPASDESLQRLLASNPFSARRTAPAERWSPGDTATALPPMMEPPSGVSFFSDSTALGDTSAADRRAPSAERVPALHGTLVDSRGSTALLLLDAARGARAYRVGEGDAGWRVLEIAPRAVTLDGPGGRLTLRLAADDTTGAH